MGRFDIQIVKLSRAVRDPVFWTFMMMIFIMVLQLWNSTTNRTTLHEIQDCTQPGGECAQRQQENVVGFINNINLVSAEASSAAAFCAVTLEVPPADYAAFKDCVSEHINLEVEVP